jgi:histone H3/H4
VKGAVIERILQELAKDVMDRTLQELKKSVMDRIMKKVGMDRILQKIKGILFSLHILTILFS